MVVTETQIKLSISFSGILHLRHAASMLARRCKVRRFNKGSLLLPFGICSTGMGLYYWFSVFAPQEGGGGGRMSFFPKLALSF